MFNSIEDVISKFNEQKYICNRRIATIVYLAASLRKPILVEGPAGVGKTELAKVIAAALNYDLLRLQCYEGLDEAKALYEWEYAKQLLYTQILKEKINEVLAGSATLKDAVDRIADQDSVFFSPKFILPRPLLQAISATDPLVLLIDEIDKSDSEFEAFLLEVLSDFQVSVPELGTIRATQIPVVVLTSNNTRELSDALKRRCLHLFIDEVVEVVQSIRKLDLKKTPSISETLDWAKALTLLNVHRLEESLVNETLNTILKYEGDVRKAEAELKDFLHKQKAKTKSPSPQDDKDLLH